VEEIQFEIKKKLKILEMQIEERYKTKKKIFVSKKTQKKKRTFRTAKELLYFCAALQTCKKLESLNLIMKNKK